MSIKVYVPRDATALSLGAQAVSSRELLQRLIASGLRRRKVHTRPRGE